MASQTERRSVERRQAERRAVSALGSRDAEIIGYRIQAPDGYLGRAADFCVEEESSVVTGILARMPRAPGGKHIFVPLNAIERIDERKKTIYVTPPRDELRRGSRRSSRSC